MRGIGASSPLSLFVAVGANFFSTPPYLSLLVVNVISFFFFFFYILHTVFKTCC